MIYISILINLHAIAYDTSTHLYDMEVEQIWLFEKSYRINSIEIQLL